MCIFFQRGGECVDIMICHLLAKKKKIQPEPPLQNNKYYKITIVYVVHNNILPMTCLYWT
jgi:hypothetical protein